MTTVCVSDEYARILTNMWYVFFVSYEGLRRTLKEPGTAAASTTLAPYLGSTGTSR